MPEDTDVVFGDLEDLGDVLNYEFKQNKVTTITSESTHNQYPSAKAVWNIKGTKLYKHIVRIEIESNIECLEFISHFATKPSWKDIIPFFSDSLSCAYVSSYEIFKLECIEEHTSTDINVYFNSVSGNIPLNIGKTEWNNATDTITEL